MSWIGRLVETYDNCITAVGNPEDVVPLLPTSHTLRNAHVEITISGEGDFIRAEVVAKKSSRTIIPCTEESDGRTRGRVAHPLSDNIEYVAGDYSNYSTEKGYYDLYLKVLKSWVEAGAHVKVASVLKYVEKSTIMRDLVSQGIFALDEDGKVVEKWTGEAEGRPLYYEVWNGIAPAKSMVRWRVVGEELEDRLFMDSDVWESWAKHYPNTIGKVGYCQVTGKHAPLASIHPTGVRRPGDSGKLISSNDNAGFSFRGRFVNSDEAFTISHEATQKAHSCLSWLIGKQGRRDGDWVSVTWSSDGGKVPNPAEDPFREYVAPVEGEAYTAETVSKKIAMKIAGYKASVGNKEVTLMVLDSATPGRISIKYYGEYSSKDFFERLDKWYDDFSWPRGVYVKDLKKRIETTAPPSPKDIARAAYGKNASDSVIGATVDRILPCVIGDRAFPRDLTNTLVSRASRPQSFDNLFEWLDVLSTACAAYRLTELKGECDMALDKERRTRSYLYGRLLAVADRIENEASKEKPNLQTNAMRYMQLFQSRPYTTWPIVAGAIIPYKAKLGSLAGWYEMLISEITDSFEIEDFMNDKPLEGEFLLGYYSQREYFYKKKEE